MNALSRRNGNYFLDSETTSNMKVESDCETRRDYLEPNCITVHATLPKIAN